jgi:hypothetical protein
MHRAATAIALLPALMAASLPCDAAGADNAESPLAVARGLSRAALADDWSYGFLAGLTTEIGPRLAATAAEARAAEWVEAKLKAAGFEQIHREKVPMPAWVRGTERGEITAPAPQHLVLTALGGSVATPPDGIEAPIALFPTYADLLAAAPGSLAGKIAVVTEKMVRVEDGSGYGAANAVRRLGPSEAAKRGAVAYLHRSLSTDNHRLAHTGKLDYAADAPRIPAAALSVPDAELLDRLAALGPV